ncbi:NAD(P)/FAD-dependent oxidoreductase [Amycolatopsis jejuensis]|uniref:NAD(P)/FAD-dependent oxidoreductase n=1 Tax=Amycolatopsis jejuensis TaxID=330084 RepID=UPI000525F08F|nr:FAD-dependent oxidoreductase [Amycolatopsis jejuensis]
MSTPTYAIVGANLAGGRAALTLRDEGFDGRIVLIGAEPHPPYERPPLSKDLLKGHREAESTYLHTEDYYAAVDIELRLGTRVERIAPRWSGLELSDGTTVTADHVLLTTGARVRRLDVLGADLDGVHYLRTLDDALAIREQLSAATNLTVVGAGFIGAEVAASAWEVCSSVTLLEAGDLPLGRAVSAEVGRFYADIHRDRGVDLRIGTGVAEIQGEHGRVRRVVTTTGDVIETDLVLIGVGTTAATELADEAGIATDNGILVDEFCRTSIPNVSAAGDVARHPNRYAGGHVRLEHWQTAQNQAMAAARAMLGRGEPYHEVPWFWSDQYDLNLQYAGHPAATDRTVRRGDPDDLSFSILSLRDNKITGVLAVNRPRDVRAAMKLIESGTPVDPDVLADAATDLRKLSTIGGR